MTRTPKKLAAIASADRSGSGAQGTSPVLEHATRSIPKATLVPLSVRNPTVGRALSKFGYVRSLKLQVGEVEAVRQAIAAFAPGSFQSFGAAATNLWEILTSFEGTPIPASLPGPDSFAPIPPATLAAFGTALVGIRQRKIKSFQTAATPAVAAPASGAKIQSAGAPVPEIALAQHLLNTTLVANKNFLFATATSPIGMFNLERLEMAPAGIERGELIATIPLAPGEQTAVVQKEWSVTSQEFTSIVTDSLENYSETGVTDNTELSQSTTSQMQHANQFNITATISGGIPLISGSVSTSFGSQDSTSKSATDSIKHATTTTQKASTRSKQEHKVTISTTTVTGTSETTTRQLTNPSTTDAIRIDYFSLMRKWRVRLYRYGLRLTYDIVIPEPAGALREAYAQREWLQTQIGPFNFPYGFADITRDNYAALAAQYLASVSAPPPDTIEMSYAASYTNPGDTTLFGPVSTVELDLPDGYQVTGATFFIEQQTGGSGTTKFANFLVMRVPASDTSWKGGAGTAALKYLVGMSGKQFVVYSTTGSNGGAVEIDVSLQLTDSGFATWQQQTWSALFNAAQTQYYAQQQDLAAQITQIDDQLNNVDTLTLRREENDEIMKGVLRFLLGPDFEFMPLPVVDAMVDAGVDIVHGVGFTGDDLGMTQMEWATVSQHGDMVRFINEAIEWENVVSFLYSYFWDVPYSWDFIRTLKHPDAARQAFLRAGAARVVLTIRKGWEESWVRFAEGGFEGAAIDPNHPYLTVAQEIAAYDDRNYPGVPPANPEGTIVRLEDAIYTTSSDTLTPSAAPVDIQVASSQGFLVGAQIVIDSQVDPAAASGRQEAQTITAIADASHITVAKIDFPHGGNGGAFPIMQPGEKGIIIAEWNEYTPSSGTDIAVTSNLTTIA